MFRKQNTLFEIYVASIIYISRLKQPFGKSQLLSLSHSTFVICVVVASIVVVVVFSVAGGGVVEPSESHVTDGVKLPFLHLNCPSVLAAKPSLHVTVNFFPLATSSPLSTEQSARC